MTKVLRSLIHEKFNFDLRVELEILSRRRDISNKEKQEELIKLLRKHNINDITPLGSGTNRYAFKLSGFVVKFATDHDGKIDNLKEFKMAKRLYPYVTRTHEVSKNGTILVAEYIQPFDSWIEMCEYQEKIRTILTEMSSVYLIGDVGLSSKNYSNWGLRIGTKEPVCLDFAYVYEVRSELFTCQFCQTNAMIVPDKDFSSLRCTHCNKPYTFEDIRAKIGNDIHRHEIGDLGEEGYVTTESNVSTELSISRSNYLEKANKKKFNNKEEYKMSNLEVIAADVSSKMEFPKRKGFVAEKPSTQTSTVGYVGYVGKTPEAKSQESTKLVKGRPIPMGPKTSTVPVYNTQGVLQEPKTPTATVKAVLTPSSVKVENPPGVTKPEPVVKKAPLPPALPNLTHLGRSISKASNMMEISMRDVDMFDKLKTCILNKKGTDSEVAELFYKAIQNCVFQSLMDFNMIPKDERGAYSTKTVFNEKRGVEERLFLSPKPSYDMPCLSTMHFLSRIFNIPILSYEKNPEKLLSKYAEKFDDYLGIQMEWIQVLKSKMEEKLGPSRKYRQGIGLNETGIATVIDFIKNMWCVSEPEPEEFVEEVQEEEDPVIGTHIIEDSEDDDDEEYDDDDYDDYDEEDDDDNDSYEPKMGISIEIRYAKDFGEAFDTIRIYTGNDRLTLYTNLDEIPNKILPSVADDRNSIWDGFIHLEVDDKFLTEDPEKYLKCNHPSAPFRILILDENNGAYEMGLFNYEGVFAVTVDEDGDQDQTRIDDDDIIPKITYLIQNDIGATSLSQYQYTVSRSDIYMDEEELLKYINICKDDDEEYDDDDDEEDEEDEEDEDSDEEIDEASAAAIDAVINDGVEEDNDSDDDQEMDNNVVTIGGSYDSREIYTLDEDGNTVFQQQTKRSKKQINRDRRKNTYDDE